jgi:CheY-like chemotaxis protein
MDCNIRTVSNGREVFDALEKEKIDIIFMDIEMPVMNGIEATKKLKSDFKYKAIPVVALTAHNLEDFSSDFDNAGFNSILEKPYSCERIAEVLEKLRIVN